MNAVGIYFIALLAAVTASAIATEQHLQTEDRGTVKEQLNHAISTLYQSVLGDQFTDSVSFSEFPPTFGHQAGRFKNDVHLNFVGNLTATFLRRDLGIPDNNMFVTQFVAEALIEAGLLSPAEAPINDTVLFNGLNSTLRNKDKRFPSNVPVFGFWEQEWKESKLAGDKSGWRQWSINMSPTLWDGEQFTDFLKFLLVDVFHLKDDYEKYLQPFHWIAQTFYTAFNIPPDSDDTSTMIAFTHWLSAIPELIPQTAGLWKSQAFNLSLAYDQVVETAYCPAALNASDLRDATDSRSFYWGRDFIQNISHPDDCLVATWIETFPYMQAVYEGLFAGPINPLNANNLDSSVQANTLYGMSVALLQGAAEWFTNPNGKGRRLYLTTARFVHFALMRQAKQKRPDLQMLYYPAVINFPYFVARHLRLLESAGSSLPFPEMFEVRDLLREALHVGGKAYIEKEMIMNCEGHSDWVCWDGFLGAGDLVDGKPTPHHDDRFYTTGVAINSLFDAYTVSVNGSTALEWIGGTAPSPDVLATLRGGVRYLLEHYNNESVSLANTFFSGSIKSINGFSLFTPANYIRDMATEVVYPCSNITWHNALNMTTSIFWVVRGIIPEAEYEQMLNGMCGNIIPWTRFEGYNSPELTWPFWSAPVLSKAYAMVAFAKAKALGLLS